MNYLTIDNIIQIAVLIVSIGGFILLYSTFMLQTETFKSQLEMSKLDYKRFLLQIRPIFAKNYPLSNFSDKEYLGKEDVKYTIILEKNSLKELYIFNIGNTLNEYINRWYIQHLTVGESVQVISGKLSFDEIILQIDIAIIFKDELDNCYIQKLSGRITRATISSPQKIDPTLFNIFKVNYIKDFNKYPMKMLKKSNNI